jgi:hypothetical protein
MTTALRATALGAAAAARGVRTPWREPAMPTLQEEEQGEEEEEEKEEEEGVVVHASGRRPGDWRA